MARSNRTPGGWGAEESGIRSRPGPEATVGCLAGQLGGCWAEMGPDYDSVNEAVIPPRINPAPGIALLAGPVLAHSDLPLPFIRAAFLPRMKPLRPLSSGAIMKLQ